MKRLIVDSNDVFGTAVMFEFDFVDYLFNAKIDGENHIKRYLNLYHAPLLARIGWSVGDFLRADCE